MTVEGVNFKVTAVDALEANYADLEQRLTELERKQSEGRAYALTFEGVFDCLHRIRMECGLERIEYETPVELTERIEQHIVNLASGYYKIRAISQQKIDRE
jgi:hypothetical protein|tara:strand:- start:12 stop:314 length:303 start_codon:yes stop_codon:yes gene_type:complete